MSTFKNKNSLRTIEAEIVQKLKNNEARPKFTGSHKKKRVPETKGSPNFKKTILKATTRPFIYLFIYLFILCVEALGVIVS